MMSQRGVNERNGGFKKTTVSLFSRKTLHEINLFGRKQKDEFSVSFAFNLVWSVATEAAGSRYAPAYLCTNRNICSHNFITQH